MMFATEILLVCAHLIILTVNVIEGLDEAPISTPSVITDLEINSYHGPCNCNNSFEMTTTREQLLQFRAIRNKRLQHEAKVGIFCLGFMLVLLFVCTLHTRMWRQQSDRISEDDESTNEHTMTASSLVRKFRHRFRPPRRKRRRKSQSSLPDMSPLLSGKHSDSDESYHGFLV